MSLSCGPLWSCPCVKYDGEIDFDRWIVALEIFDTWLQRAGGSPLNFLFHFSVYSDTELGDAFGKRVMAITSRQRQWKDVDFYWSCFDFSSEFTGFRIGDMPLLTSLSFYLSLRRLDDSVPCSQIELSNSPDLRLFRLDGIFTWEIDGSMYEENVDQSNTGNFSWSFTFVLSF